MRDAATERSALPRRRVLIGGMGLILGATALPTLARADTRMLTPRQTAGPFYPGHLDIAALDENLLRQEDGPETTEGTLLSLTGRVLGPRGRAIPNAAGTSSRRSQSIRTCPRCTSAWRSATGCLTMTGKPPTHRFGARWN